MNLITGVGQLDSYGGLLWTNTDQLDQYWMDEQLCGVLSARIVARPDLPGLLNQMRLTLLEGIPGEPLLSHLRGRRCLRTARRVQILGLIVSGYNEKLVFFLQRCDLKPSVCSSSGKRKSSIHLSELCVKWPSSRTHSIHAFHCIDCSALKQPFVASCTKTVFQKSKT